MDTRERGFWNEWNAAHRESDLADVSMRQAEVIESWLAGRKDLSILDAGCGSGWFTARLLQFGSVVGTDLADEVLARARARVPAATFVAGDVMTVDVGTGFDVVVTLEVLSHVSDQDAFLRRLHSLLVPGGRLLLATQNRPILERFNRIPAAAPGQRRRWVDRRELRTLAGAAGFHIESMIVVSPKADHGVMRFIARVARKARCTRMLEHLGFGWTIMLSAVAFPLPSTTSELPCSS